ncbi:PREDICTED: uncharacterized protein LOC109483970 [Branchiostoma belcheri]|uniref:Uncharacterized protein LOC109483970 n=1 Tax=Branchiostoma belcheri TaxID=7741 RepID=A0A6P5AKY6_BRABE|nr:PREDICTED: uncharacterized protein LOC109483970 [Branchiostoma belcheri]
MAGMEGARDRLTSSARKRKKRDKFKKRVLLGDMFVEWRDLKSALGLKTDCDLARLLINSYRQHSDTDTPRPSSPQSPPSNAPSPPKTVTPSHASTPHVTQQPPNLNAGDISSISPGSSSTVSVVSSCSKLAEDMRSLPIISPEEEVFAHDQSVAEGDDEDYVFVSPEELQIREEGDIVGLQCWIGYTESLLALVRYMQLPYDKCKEKECRAEVDKEPETKTV